MAQEFSQCPLALISHLCCWLESSHMPKKELTCWCFYWCWLPNSKAVLSPLVLPLLLMARICRQINHNQSRTRPWSKDQPDEKLLRLTRCALEPWHALIDPVMGESRRSLLVDCHREWLHAHFQTKGVRVRITSVHLECRPAQKHDHSDLENVMMSLVDVSRLQILGHQERWIWRTAQLANEMKSNILLDFCNYWLCKWKRKVFMFKFFFQFFIPAHTLLYDINADSRLSFYLNWRPCTGQYVIYSYQPNRTLNTVKCCCLDEKPQYIKDGILWSAGVSMKGGFPADRCITMRSCLLITFLSSGFNVVANVCFLNIQIFLIVPMFKKIKGVSYFTMKPIHRKSMCAASRFYVTLGWAEYCTSNNGAASLPLTRGFAVQFPSPAVCWNFLQQDTEPQIAPDVPPVCDCMSE